MLVVDRTASYASTGASHFSTSDSGSPCAGVVLDLVASDLADGKVLRLRVGKIETAHRRRRPHSIALGKRDAEFRRVQQPEQIAFFGVVGTGGVTRRRAYAAILFAIKASLSRISSAA